MTRELLALTADGAEGNQPGDGFDAATIADRAGVDVDSVDDGRMLIRFGAASSFTSTSELRDVLESGLNA